MSGEGGRREGSRGRKCLRAGKKRRGVGAREGGLDGSGSAVAAAGSV